MRGFNMEINNFIRHHIKGLVQRSTVYETWYLDMITDRWSQDRPQVKVCDYRSVEYYLINGTRYYDHDKAIEAMTDIFCGDVSKMILYDIVFEDECDSVLGVVSDKKMYKRINMNAPVCMGDLQ